MPPRPWSGPSRRQRRRRGRRSRARRSSCPGRTPSARGSTPPARPGAVGSPPRRARPRRPPAATRTTCRCRSRRRRRARPAARCVDSSTTVTRTETALKTPTPGAASDTCEPVLENEARARAGSRRRPRARGRRRPSSRPAAEAPPDTRHGSAQIAVADGGDEERSLRDRVVDGALLDRGGRRSAEAQVDDLGAVVDRIDDRRCLVDVAERAARAAGLHDHQACLAADAGDPVAVRRRSGGERGDEGAVAVARRGRRRAACGCCRCAAPSR